MRRSRILILLVALPLLAATASAQAVLPEKGHEPGLRENIFGLGADFGAACGLGLSFRHHLPSVFSYQITGGIIKVDDKLSYDFGMEGQYDLVRGALNRFYVAGCFAYYYSGRTSHNDLSGPWRMGLGIGGEQSFDSGLHGSLELVFTYFSDGTVLPLPQAGFHYYFY